MTQQANARPDEARAPSLAGIRVLDLGRYIAAPFCAQMLSNEGAEVIRVEPPEGATDREVMPIGLEGRGGLYLQVNANKKSLTLDYTNPAGRAVLDALIGTSDVLIVNLPYKALRQLKLDYESLTAIKPDIILTTISAFSYGGEDRDRVGFDGTGQALSGAMYLTGFGDSPTREAVSYVDYATAMSAAFATLSALIDRRRSGRGQHVQCSLMGTALTMMNAMLMEEASGYRSRKPIGNRSPIAGPSDLFRAKDGWLMIQVIGDPMFGRWASMMGRPELTSDPSFRSDSDRGENGAELSAIQQDWCAARSVAECLAELAASRLPACRCLTPKGTLALDSFGDYVDPVLIEEKGWSLPLVTRAIRTEASAHAPRRMAPSLGADTQALLGQLGLDRAKLADLKAQGAI